MRTNCFVTKVLLFFMLAFMGVSTQAQCPDVVRGPYLEPGSGGQPSASITIRWRTEIGSAMKLCYRNLGATSSSYQCETVYSTEEDIYQPLTEDGDGFEYSICTVSDYSKTISVNSPQEYEIRCTNGFTKERGEIYPSLPKGQSLTTPLNIWVIGDGGVENPGEVLNAFKNYTPTSEIDALMLLGDNSYSMAEDPSSFTACSTRYNCDSYCGDDGSDYAYQNTVFNRFENELKNTIVWPAIGNHEVDYGMANSNVHEFFEMFSYVDANKGYYSYDYGNVHFVCLNSEINDGVFDEEVNDMATWLTNDLQASTNADWTIVYFHHPIYSAGSKEKRNTLLTDMESDMEAMITHVAPILDQFEVDLVLSGHNHHYERSFLIDGHYNVNDSSLPTFNPNNANMLLDDGCNGCLATYNPNSFSPDIFNSNFTKTDKGTVYVVLGSSGKLGSSASSQVFFNHPMMRPFEPAGTSHSTNDGRGLLKKGTMKLSIDDNTLTATFVSPDSNNSNSYQILDEFTITKNSATNITTDLRIGNMGISPSTTVRNGDYIKMSCRQYVSGATAPLSARVGFYLSDDKILNINEDMYLGKSISNFSNSPSNEYEAHFKTVKSTWGTGVKYILYKADYNNQIPETNENNNVQYLQINVNVDNCTETFEKQVSHSYYDAEERVSDGYMNRSSSDLEFGRDYSTEQKIGLRFSGVNIPSGATICDAKIEFIAEGASDDNFTVQIKGQVGANMNGFYNSNYDISNRPKTDANIDWNFGNNVWSNNEVVETPNLASIVQEIVDNNQWNSGNNMFFFFENENGIGTRRVYSYNDHYSKAARLIVTYDINGKTITLDEKATEEPSLFPNPIHEGSVLNINLNNSMMENPVKVTIYDCVGKLIFNQTFQEHQQQIAISEEKLKTGIYLVKIQSGNSEKIEKLLVL